MEVSINHWKTNMQQKINNMVICWWMGKTSCKAKAPSSEFKITTPKNPLINNQAITKYLGLSQNTLDYPKIPTYDWTFAPILNWTWSSSDFFSSCTNFQFVTNSNNLNDCYWLQSSSLHKRWRSRSTWLQNSKAYKRNSFTQSISVLGVFVLDNF